MPCFIEAQLMAINNISPVQLLQIVPPASESFLVLFLLKKCQDISDPTHAVSRWPQHETSSWAAFWPQVQWHLAHQARQGRLLVSQVVLQVPHRERAAGSDPEVLRWDRPLESHRPGAAARTSSAGAILIMALRRSAGTCANSMAYRMGSGMGSRLGVGLAWPVESATRTNASAKSQLQQHPRLCNRTSPHTRTGLGNPVGLLGAGHYRAVARHPLQRHHRAPGVAATRVYLVR